MPSSSSSFSASVTVMIMMLLVPTSSLLLMMIMPSCGMMIMANGFSIGKKDIMHAAPVGTARYPRAHHHHPHLITRFGGAATIGPDKSNHHSITAMAAGKHGSDVQDKEDGDVRRRDHDHQVAMYLCRHGKIPAAGTSFGISEGSHKTLISHQQRSHDLDDGDRSSSSSKLSMTSITIDPPSRTPPAGMTSITSAQGIILRFGRQAAALIKLVSQKGTRIHVVNSIVSILTAAFMVATSQAIAVTKPVLLARCSHLIMLLGFGMLLFDNTVLAAGRHIGAGNRLRRLSKARLVGHASTVSLMFVPIIQAAQLHNLIGSRIAMLLLTATSMHTIQESMFWMSYDHNKFQTVDNRDVVKHSGRYLAGTLAYSSGKVMRCVLPVVIQNGMSVLVGGMLWKRLGSLSGALMCASGLTAFLVCSLQRPDIQSMGEPLSMGLLWSSILAMSTMPMAITI